MHLSDNLLYAMIDHEPAGPDAQAARTHLQQCAACQARYQTLAAQTSRVRARLNALAPTPAERPDPAPAAYRRLVNNHTTSFHQRKEPFQTMYKRRSLWTTLAVITALVLVFTITPASAWASSFLGLFRVQKVQVVTFNPDAVENAQNRLQANEAVIKEIFKDDLKIDEHGQAVTVTSAAEAAQKAGYTPRLPAAITPAKMLVKPGMNVTFTINQPKLQELIDAAGVDVQLSKETNGKVVTSEISSAVVVASQGCNLVDGEARSDPDLPENCTSLVQMPSPAVNTPEGLNIQQIGQAMFQFLGLPEAEAQQLSQKIDWTSTLILPIPQGGQFQYQDVQVDGVTGTFLEETKQHSYSLFWVKDGMLYGLHGPGGLTEAQQIAGSLR